MARLVATSLCVHKRHSRCSVTNQQACVDGDAKKLFLRTIQDQPSSASSRFPTEGTLGSPSEVKEPGRWHVGDPSHREVEHPSWRQIFYMETKMDKMLFISHASQCCEGICQKQPKHFLLSLHLKPWRTATAQAAPWWCVGGFFCPISQLPDNHTETY